MLITKMMTIFSLYIQCLGTLRTWPIFPKYSNKWNCCKPTGMSQNVQHSDEMETEKYRKA